MDRAQWLEERKKGIGGSDLAPILGISPYSTALDIYNEKLSLVTKEKTESTAMMMGNILEPVIRDMYVEVTGEEMEKHDQIIRKDFMIASLDGLTKSGKVLEIKTARNDKGWGEEGTDEIPIHYATQVQHYLMVTGAELADVAVLIAGSDFRIYTVHANKELQELIFKKEKEFWEMVQNKTPPEPQNSNDLSILYPHSSLDSIDITPEIRDKIGLLAILSKEYKDLDVRIESLKFQLKSFMKDSECILDAGNPIVTYKSTKGRVTTKWEEVVIALEQKYGEEVKKIIQEKTSESKGYRRFLIK